MIVEEHVDLGECMQNRELSWLKFNRRVLEEAACTTEPPLERLKFLSIFTSNLDEFYMVRVGGLTYRRIFFPQYRENKTFMSADEQIQAILEETASLYARRDDLFAQVSSVLEENGVVHCRPEALDPDELRRLEKHFIRSILPYLSPQVLTARHPFPHLANKGLYVAVALDKRDASTIGLINLPPGLSRVIYLQEGGHRFVLLEDVIAYFTGSIFNSYTVYDKAILKVTRNTDLDMEESMMEEDLDYRQIMKKVLRKRQHLAAVRLDCQGACSEALVKYFRKRLDLAPEQVFASRAPVDLTYAYQLEDHLDEAERQRLVRRPHTPAITVPAQGLANMYSYVQRGDVLLSYPYESISPFLTMVRQAAMDSSVVSIKITLYRIDMQSRLADSLILAAENGKDITVLLELRARFDEENNIEWAHRLESAGCRVIYGLPGYKVHSKVCLITRRELGRLRYVTQIGTGNYNEKTAGQYTDLALITANQEIGEDATAFFQNLLLGKLDGEYKHLITSPHGLKAQLIAHIEAQRDLAASGRAGRIVIKCNSVSDRDVMEKLIEASQAGVKISMVVRGICCLTPGVPGLTENITITSIVGRFLEHSRIYCFGTGADEEIFISSADLMTRNMERRVEVACPIYDPAIKEKIRHILELILLDNVKARDHLPDGTYVQRQPPPDLVISAQETFRDEAEKQAAQIIAAGQQRTPRRGIAALRDTVKLVFANLRQMFRRKK